MRGALFRRQLWLACALLALTSADGCDLNPQPLPPTPSSPGGFETGNPGDGASSGGPMNISGSSSGAGAGGASSGSSSGAPIFGSSSGGGSASAPEEDA